MSGVLDIARRLGGQVAGQNRVLAPGPGHSVRDRSLSVRLDPAAPDGFCVHSFAGDDWRLCRDHVRHVLRIGDYSRESIPAPRRACRGASGAEAAKNVQMAGQIWREGTPVGSTAAEYYLIRFHGSCPFRLDSGEIARLPTMIGAMVDIRTNEFRGVHRTALRPDGSGKAVHPGLGNSKKMLGGARDACIKLSPDEEVTAGLHIAEGIETALACMTAGFRPIWAVLSAGGVARFPVLPGIEAITIMADNDASGTGMTAARDCARRWTGAEREATVLFRHETGRDWADPIGRPT
jgi:hypothetical protein